MKRWAIITVALYGLALLALTLPGCLLFAVEFSEADKTWSTAHTLFTHWGYWLWLGVLISGQAALLLVPVDLARRRTPSRRKLMVPVATASFLLGNLLFAGLFSVLSAFLGDESSIVVEAPAGVAEQLARQFPPATAAFKSLGIRPDMDFFSITTAIGMLVAFWIAWALVFYHYAQSDNPDGLLRRGTRWLLRASILELLVAIPSHIIVRHRNDCCAPFVTFWGIVTGISVMLLAFGPGVFFLFAKRIRHSRTPANSPRARP